MWLTSCCHASAQVCNGQEGTVGDKLEIGPLSLCLWERASTIQSQPPSGIFLPSPPSLKACSVTTGWHERPSVSNENERDVDVSAWPNAMHYGRRLSSWLWISVFLSDLSGLFDLQYPMLTTYLLSAAKSCIHHKKSEGSKYCERNCFASIPPQIEQSTRSRNISHRERRFPTP